MKNIIKNLFGLLGCIIFFYFVITFLGLSNFLLPVISVAIFIILIILSIFLFCHFLVSLFSSTSKLFKNPTTKMTVKKYPVYSSNIDSEEQEFYIKINFLKRKLIFCEQMLCHHLELHKIEEQYKTLTLTRKMLAIMSEKFTCSDLRIFYKFEENIKKMARLFEYGQGSNVTDSYKSISLDIKKDAEMLFQYLKKDKN